MRASFRRASVLWGSLTGAPVGWSRRTASCQVGRGVDEGTLLRAQRRRRLGTIPELLGDAVPVGGRAEPGEDRVHAPLDAVEQQIVGRQVELAQHLDVAKPRIGRRANDLAGELGGVGVLLVREVIRTTTDPRLGYVEMLRKLNLPPDYLLLNRIQWGVNSILARLGATANWHRIAKEFWDGAEPATPLGAEERPFIDASPYLA